jgi:DNA-directed RNA polymerase III subunit RPC4
MTRGGFGGSHDPVGGRYIPEPQYPDEDDDAPRVDIEHINEQSDSEEDVIITGIRSLNKSKGKMSNKGGLKPVRLDRKEHKERVTMVNTEPNIKPAPEDDRNDTDMMIIDDGGSSKTIPHQREWKGTYDNDIQIKSEPGIVPEISYPQEPTASSSHRSEFKVPTEVGADDPEPEPANAERASPHIERKAKPRRSSKRKDKMPVIQTEEDRAEWARHLEDMDILRKELSGMATNLRPENQGKDVEGDVDMERTAVPEAPKHEKEDGRVYLFQFPPVLPKLYNDKTSSNPNNVIDDDDVEMMVSHDLTKDDKAEIKSEEKVIEIKQEELDDDEVKKQKEREKLVIEEGAIGKLVLRESGEVELVWGGTNMKVGRGIETNFFSLGAVVDGMDHWQKDEKGRDIAAINGSRGKSMAMGEIMGKFVVTPDWTNIH